MTKKKSGKVNKSIDLENLDDLQENTIEEEPIDVEESYDEEDIPVIVDDSILKESSDEDEDWDDDLDVDVDDLDELNDLAESYDIKERIKKNKKENEEAIEKDAKRSKTKVVVIEVVATLLVLFAAFAIYGLVQIKPLKEQARLVKSEVKEVVISIATEDPSVARMKADKMLADNAELRKKVQSPYWKIISHLPIVGRQLNDAIELTYILEDVDRDVFRPTIDMVERHPIENILTEDFVNTDAIYDYLEHVQYLSPTMDSLTARMNVLKVDMVDGDGKVRKYIGLFNRASDVIDNSLIRVATPLLNERNSGIFDNIKIDTGIDSENLVELLSFLDELLPEVVAAADYVKNLDWQGIDDTGMIIEYASDISALAASIDRACDKVVSPLIVQLGLYPLDNMKHDEGFDVITIKSYLDFIEEVMPGFKEVSDELNNIQFKRIGSIDAVSEYIEKLDHIIDTYYEAEDFIPLIRAVIGDGSDKLYLFATQNTAEIRASGGFPGCVGTIEIEDGALKIGDFKSIYDCFKYENPVGSEITEQERTLFRGMPYPWDADFCPDFERVGKIFALAYEERIASKEGKKVAGTISMTPGIVQELLKVFGEITISDGTVLDGTNATEYIQNTIYVRYQNEKSNENQDNAFVDKLFNETAQKAMSLLTDNFSIEYMPDYLNILKKGVKDRTIMFWFADEEQQKIAMETGSSGGLNKDKNNPEAGIYFNVYTASKMGWYMDIDKQCSLPKHNPDGSCSYDVKVTYTNTMTRKESTMVKGYITNSGGWTDCTAYMFAPAGGTVSNFVTSNKQMIKLDNYNGLDLGYFHLGLGPGSTITVTYTVTTAPGVDTPLKFSMTPTATKYRTGREISEDQLLTEEEIEALKELAEQQNS